MFMYQSRGPNHSFKIWLAASTEMTPDRLAIFSSDIRQLRQLYACCAALLLRNQAATFLALQHLARRKRHDHLWKE